MQTQREGIPFDPDAWEGNPEMLVGTDEQLTCDADLCDRTFASKQEAFNSGFFLGEEPFLRARREVSTSAPQFDRHACAEVLGAIEQQAWGDVGQAAEGIDIALRLAMEATTAAFLQWEADNSGERRFGDEFSLTAEQVRDLDPEWRLAYVARLLRTLALAWGVSTEFSAGALGTAEHDTSTVGWLMHKLHAIMGQSLARQN